MSIQYAKVRCHAIVPFKGNHHNYLDSQGYTKKCGAPTDYMVQITGSNRWYRVKVWCFSNTATYFITVKNQNIIVNDLDLPLWS